MSSLSTQNQTNIKKPNIGEKDQDQFPEGGRGWLVVAGCFVILGQTYGLINAYGQYQIEYEKLYPGTKSEILALIGSLQPFMVNLSSVVAVPLIKAIGPRFTVLIAMVIISFGYMMLSLAKEIWQVFLAQGIVIGVGLGLCCFVGFSIPQQWFKKRRALAVGIVASGSSLGGTVWPIAVSHLEKQVGMPWTNRIIGFIYLPLLAFAAIAVKARVLPSSSSSQNNQDIESKQEKESHHSHHSLANLPDDIIANELAEEMGLEESGSIKTSDKSNATKKLQQELPRKKYLGIFHSHFLLDWTVSKDWTFQVYLFSTFMAFLGLFLPLFYLPTYCQRIGASPNIYNYILTILNAASIIGRIVPGYIGDKIGRLNSLIPFVLFSGISILVFWLPTNTVALAIVFAVAYGISSGSVISLYPSVIGQLFGIEGLPSRLTLMFLANAIPSLIGPLIGGSFLPLEQDVGDRGFYKLMVFSAVSFLVAAAALIYLRLSISRKLFVFL